MSHNRVYVILNMCIFNNDFFYKKVKNKLRKILEILVSNNLICKDL